MPLDSNTYEISFLPLGPQKIEHKEEHCSTELNNVSEDLNLNLVCRFCAVQNERFIGIFSEEGISNDLANKINLYLPVKVSQDDQLPLQCCWNCASTLIAWHELVITSVECDQRFRTSALNSLKVLPTNPTTSFEQPEGISEDSEGLVEIAILYTYIHQPLLKLTDH